MTAKTARSKKAKGSRLEHKFAAMLRESGMDPDARRQLLSGAGHRKGDIDTELPYCFECKNQERLSLWRSWEQATGQAGDKTPVLVVSANRRPVLVVMRAEDWIDERRP